MSRTILIFGASSGIGLATASLAAAESWRVVAASRRGVTPGLESPLVRAERCDVRDYEAVCDLVGAHADADAVVNCAGVGAYAPLGRDMAPYWRDIVDTTLLGCIHVLSATLRLARACPIVAIVGSLAGQRPSPTEGNDVYAAAKAGMARAVADFRLRLRQQGNAMKVALVVPGFVEGTDFGRTYFRSAEGEGRDLYAGFPSLTPADVARTLWWCLNQPDTVDIGTVVVRPLMQPD